MPLKNLTRERVLARQRTGSKSLRAFHDGGQIVIELEDDGRGIDAARIKAKAAREGGRY